MKYKALVVDVDGTLVVAKHDALPTVKVAEAMEKASKKLHVSIATGRCLPWVSHVIDFLNLKNPCVLQGGAYIYDSRSKKTISEYVLHEKELTLLQEIFQEENTPFVYCDNTIREHPEFSLTDTIPDKAFMVFSMGVDPKLAHTLSLKIAKATGTMVHTAPSWTKGKSDILITNTQATKQHGIFEIANILGIETHEIIGVGDGNNDLPLLMACGLKVAMGNAGDDLKAIADYIAPSVEEDGLAEVIDRFILHP